LAAGQDPRHTGTGPKFTHPYKSRSTLWKFLQQVWNCQA